jgi:hypothetical protein
MTGQRGMIRGDAQNGCVNGGTHIIQPESVSGGGQRRH